MMRDLSRPEQIAIKNDIHAMAKALETISLVMPDDKKVAIENENNNTDEFFGKLYISEKHLDALKEEYGYKVTLSEVGLMEECSELIQALSKRIRATYPKKDNVIEEMAHVITCIRLVCLQLNISPDDIQQEIYKKYPDGYKEKENCDVN